MHEHRCIPFPFLPVTAVPCPLPAAACFSFLPAHPAASFRRGASKSRVSTRLFEAPFEEQGEQEEEQKEEELKPSCGKEPAAGRQN